MLGCISFTIDGKAQRVELGFWKGQSYTREAATSIFVFQNMHSLTLDDCPLHYLQNSKHLRECYGIAEPKGEAKV